MQINLGEIGMSLFVLTNSVALRPSVVIMLACQVLKEY